MIKHLHTILGTSSEQDVAFSGQELMTQMTEDEVIIFSYRR